MSVSCGENRVREAILNVTFLPPSVLLCRTEALGVVVDRRRRDLGDGSVGDNVSRNIVPMSRRHGV